MNVQERMREQKEQRKVAEAMKLWKEFSIPKGVRRAARMMGIAWHVPLCIVTFGLWIPV